MLEFQNQLESETGGEADEVGQDHPILKEFSEALANDLNIAGALSVVHPWIRSNPEKANAREALGVWRKINSVLGIEDTVGPTEEEEATLELAEQWCEEMNTARQQKDWPTADALRQKIIDAGFKVNQTKEGATIQKQLV